MNVKQLINKLESLYDQIDDMSSDRDYSFSDRSENWQLSDKGELYEELTETINEIKEDIYRAISNLNERL